MLQHPGTPVGRRKRCSCVLELRAEFMVADFTETQAVSSYPKKEGNGETQSSLLMTRSDAALLCFLLLWRKQ